MPYRAERSVNAFVVTLADANASGMEYLSGVDHIALRAQPEERQSRTGNQM
jgi:hypothetical protein